MRIFLQLALCFCVLIAAGEPMTVSWIPNTEPDLAGYVLEYLIEGTSEWAQEPLDDPTLSYITFDTPSESISLRLRLRAYDASLNLSDPSAEVEVHIAPPGTDPCGR